MAREVEPDPVAAEQPAAGAAGVGHLHDQEPARREPADHARERGQRPRQVLDDVERGDDVEGAGGERRLHRIADEHVGRHRLRLGRRNRIDLDAGHAPAHHFHLVQESSVGAADVEQAPLADPRREVLADLAPVQPRPPSGGRAGVGGRQVLVAEPGRERPAHGRPRVSQHARHLGVARVRRVVVGVRAVELVLAHARILLQQPAAAAARERKAAGNAERDVVQPAQRGHVAAATERAGDGLELEGGAHGRRRARVDMALTEE